jgi:Predicted membrane protein
MSTLGNILWLLLGGIIIALMYLVGSILLMVTIIGIPFGIQNLKFVGLALWPFGRKVVNKPEEPGCLSTIMNIFWIIFGGIEICLTHILFALLLYITIIGIPFANQHMKLAKIALAPFGKEVISE